MIIKNRKNGFISLIFFSLLTFIFWRLEIEFHGWKGLIWLSYFQKSIFLNLFLFILWVNIFFNLKNKLLANFFLIIWIILATVAFIMSLQSLFSVGFNFGYHFSMSKFQLTLLHFCRFIFLPFFPMISILSLRLINIKVKFKYIILSQILYLSAFPIAIFLLYLLSHKGGPNLIHALKSGFVFPFLFFSLGLPLLFSYYSNKKHLPTNNMILDNNID